MNNQLINSKIERMCKLPQNGKTYICQSLNYEGQISTDIFDFDEMRSWLVRMQAEVPQPMIKVVDEATGEKI